MLQARAELSGMAYYMWLITVVKAVASLKKSYAAGKEKNTSLNTHTQKSLSSLCV